MPAIRLENVAVSAASITVTCHPERSWSREATPTQSKDPAQVGAHAEVSGSSGWDVCQNALQHQSGGHVRGILRLRVQCASRTERFAQDDGYFV